MAGFLRAATVAAALAGLLGVGGSPAEQAERPLPERLSDTGLFEPGSVDAVRADVLAFTPQYPLWSDGAAKRRWLALPAGAAIDGRDPDAWDFPPGTRLWKEFSLGGRRIETRYIERTPRGDWRFAAYVWNEAGTEAVLAPPRGIRALPVAGAPEGRYTVPSRGDCLACHGGAPVPVLGASALQLSPLRDGSSPTGGVDLRALVAGGWLRGLPSALLAEPPRIASDAPLERAALGYLHGNCAHCHHRAGGQVPLALTLAQRVGDPTNSLQEVREATHGASSRFLPAGTSHTRVIARGDPAASVLLHRMATRDPRQQMPPLGTTQADSQAVALIHDWIASLPPAPTAP
jgi:hypothetical protein